MRLPIPVAAVCVVALISVATTSAATPRAANPALTKPITLNLLGTYSTGVYDEGAAEIVAHDPATQRAFVVDGAGGKIDILNVTTPTTPTLVGSIALSPTYGKAANSVAVANGVVAAAVEATVKTDAGKVVGSV